MEGLRSQFQQQQASYTKQINELIEQYALWKAFKA